MLRAVVLSVIFVIRAISGTMFATVCDTPSSVPCDLESREAPATALNAVVSSSLADTWSLRELYPPEQSGTFLMWRADADKSRFSFALSSPLLTSPTHTQEIDERHEPSKGALALLLLFVIILGTSARNWRHASLSEFAVAAGKPGFPDQRVECVAPERAGKS